MEGYLGHYYPKPFETAGKERKVVPVSNPGLLSYDTHRHPPSFLPFYYSALGVIIDVWLLRAIVDHGQRIVSGITAFPMAPLFFLSLCHFKGLSIVMALDCLRLDFLYWSSDHREIPSIRSTPHAVILLTILHDQQLYTAIKRVFNQHIL